MADLIQVSAITATVVCPGGPRIRLFVGRKDNEQPGPRGLLPSPFDNAEYLISLFGNKTFSSTDLVALVGAHSVSRQGSVDATRLGAPQDDTPAVWDNQFFTDTLSADNETVLILPSDASLSAFSETSAQWKEFAGSNNMSTWDPAYARAYVRMSMLGLGNMNNLTECTQILPPAIALP
ncbi:putative Peroxidase [Seiridium cardinale]